MRASSLTPSPTPGLCLKGRGAIGGSPRAVAERSRGMCRRLREAVSGGWECGWGLVLGYGNAFGVESVQWGGGRGPPPPLQAIPCLTHMGPFLRRSVPQCPQRPVESRKPRTPQRKPLPSPSPLRRSFRIAHTLWAALCCGVLCCGAQAVLWMARGGAGAAQCSAVFRVDAVCHSLIHKGLRAVPLGPAFLERSGGTLFEREVARTRRRRACAGARTKTSLVECTLGGDGGV